MLRKTLLAAGAAAAVAAAAGPAAAHCQLIYTPETNLATPAAQVKLIFWHPLAVGYVMEMGQPEAFFYVHQGERTDVMDALTPIAFNGGDNAGAAYEANLVLRTPGDYILTVVPAPYYEATEDIYIQQITKSYVNRGGLPTDWPDEVGLPVEIIPLNNPNNILAGSTFTGRVLVGGEPFACPEIEIEYIAAAPDMATNTAMEPTVGQPAGGTINAVCDEDGYFTFGVPRAGFWGFAALDLVEGSTLDERPLSVDAVIWVRAYDF
jgi:cobalt/nickel transport protein